MALVSFVLLLFPSASYVVVGQTIYEFEGIELIFGYTSKNDVLNFNVLGFLMFILLIMSIISPMIHIKNLKTKSFFEIICLLITTVLYYLLPVTVCHSTEISNDVFKINGTIYIGATISLISLMLSIYALKIVVKEKKYEKTN